MIARVGKILVFGLRTLTVLFMFMAWSPLIVFGQDEEADGTVALRTVTVDAERPDWEKILSPGAVSVVMPDDFKGEQKDLAALLDTVPGLHVQRVTGTGQYTTVRVRGSTAAQVNVYVDGVLQNVGNDMAVDLSLIPVSQVARVEVYRGYVPARFAGSPIGGVINVVTKKADRLGVTAEAGVKTLGGQVYNLTATTPAFWDGSVLIGAHYDKSDADFEFTRGDWFRQNYIPDARTTIARRHNEYSNQDVMFKWQNDLFSFKAAYKETERHLPDVVSYNEHFTDFYQLQKTNQTDLVAGYRNTWDKLDVGVQFFYLYQNKGTTGHNLPPGEYWNIYAISPGLLRQDRETEKHGGQIDLSYDLGERHLLELHGDYSKEKLYVDASPRLIYDKDNPDMGYGPGWYVSPSPTGWYYFPLYLEERAHLQAQDTITLGNDGSTKLTLIVRQDQARSSGNSRDDNSWQSSWGTALVKDVDDSLSFRATMGTFNRYPNFTERFGDGIYVMPQNPNPETSVPCV